MALLIIKVEVDVDPTLEDPEEVAWDLLFDQRVDGIRQYADCPTTFIRSDWADKRARQKR